MEQLLFPAAHSEKNEYLFDHIERNEFDLKNCTQ